MEGRCSAHRKKLFGIYRIFRIQIPDGVVAAQANAEAVSGVYHQQVDQAVHGQDAGLDQIGVEDREALVRGIQDGTIDMIATDHAPHSAEEKVKGLEKSAFGVVGIETAFPICYTYLVKTGIITMDKLMELLVINPRKRFNIPLGNDFSIWDLEASYTVDPADFLSMGKATPFAGWTVQGKCMATVCDGKIVYNSL